MDGERLDLSPTSEKPKVTDEELNSRYAKGDIRIVTESARYPLTGILSMLRERKPQEGSDGDQDELRYKLDPEYQRRHRWTVERKSKLIESFLMNVPVPPVFLYERDLARFEVMDGRQRLTALSEFYEDKFPLTGLQYWADLDGRTYSKLPSKVRDGIDRRYISSIILLKETAATPEQEALLKKMVFERLNSGGVKLSSQETRNAVYNGQLNRLCLRLSENANFRRMWGIPLDADSLDTSEFDGPDASTSDELRQDDGFTDDGATSTGKRMFEKMEDVELILRFFAYRQLETSRAGLNKITEFLDYFLVAGNEFPQQVLHAYERMFTDTIQFLWDSLGTEAFSIIGNRRARPTKIVFDPIMYVANSPEVTASRSKLVDYKAVLRTNLKKMYADDAATGHPVFSGRRTNLADTQARNQQMMHAFRSAIQAVAQPIV